MLTRGGKDRLSSVDVSIQLSLESDRLDPSSIVLLQMLSLMPDGVLDEDLPKMTPVNINLHNGSSTILQTSLAFRDTHRHLKCLTPIREHIRLASTSDSTDPVA